MNIFRTSCIAMLLCLGIGTHLLNAHNIEQSASNYSTFPHTDVWDGSLRRPIVGDGTKDNPFLITSAKEFAFLMQNYDNNNNECLHSYYKLTCDIDMNWAIWQFGTASVANRTFLANFDGCGHKISHITLNVVASTEETHVGLFSQLGGDKDFEGTIQNLVVDGIRIVYAGDRFGVTPVNQYRIGGLVGQMYANSKIDNCLVYNVTIEDISKTMPIPVKGLMKAGPIVGDIQNSFGDNELKAKVPTAKIENSYGVLESKLARNHGKDMVLSIETKQGVERKDMERIHATLVETKSDMNGRTYHLDIDSKLPDGATINWQLDGTAINTTGQDCSIDFDCKNRSLSAEVLDRDGKVLCRVGKLVEPVKMRLKISSVKTAGKVQTIQAQVIGEGSNNFISKQMLYEWQDLSDGGKVVGTSLTLASAVTGHTYLLVARHQRYQFYALSTLYTTKRPIYVNLNGITSAEDIAKYTLDGKTAYPAGNDINDGHSPETAVRTLQRAYDMLDTEEDGGNIANNVIVIMGDYDREIWSFYSDVACTTENPDALKRGNKPALITGAYGNVCNGSVLMTGEAVLMEADTRFENLCLHGKAESKEIERLSIMAQDHNLTMGYGITLENYSSADEQRGLAEGAYAPLTTIYGGFLNPTDTEYDDQPNTITIYSGYWGRIIAGSRYKRNVYESGNVTGSPRHPVRTNIVLDVANALNPFENPHDVSLVVGGQGDGSCYALSNILIKGTSTVGRIIGGNIGFGRKGVQIIRGKELARPSDSFYGQTVITVESGIVGEIYGTNLGRNGLLLHPGMDNMIDSCACYFYGTAEINLKGGSIRNTVYGAGAGGVTGLQSYYYNDKPTNDPLIPYILSNGQLAYGTFKQANGKIPHILVEGDSLIRMEKTNVRINISDRVHIYSSVYGGGHGYSNQLRTSYACTQAGNVFGTININMTGGIVEGNIYGGGRGSLAYFDNHDLATYNPRGITAANFSSLAQVHGITNVQISGGVVKGAVFAAGEGSHYRTADTNNGNNIASKMAAVYGNSTLKISGDAELMDCVFGGGDFGDIVDVVPTDKIPATYVKISGGKFHNSIFAGGRGLDDIKNPERSVMSNIEGSTRIDITGGEFVMDNTRSRFGRRYYGVFGGGHSASVITQDTYVNAHRSLFSKEFAEAAGIQTWSVDKPWDMNYAICGGGFGKKTDVMGNTNVIIDLADVKAPDSGTMIGLASLNDISTQAFIPHEQFMDIFGGGLMGNVQGSTNVTISGNPVIRNIYGGSLIGTCGTRDQKLNGESMFTRYDNDREYTTGSYVNLLSGRIWRAYGGSLMGDVCGETHLTIGSKDKDNSNKDLYVVYAFGGNDACGTIAGSNNEKYGTHVNMYGGNIIKAIYGSGDGQNMQFDDPNQENEARMNAPRARVRPHVASAEINVLGNSKEDYANIINNLFCGGNNTTVALFTRDSTDHNEWGLVRELLTPNTGKVKLNIGNNVSIRNLYMGCNGSEFFATAPHYTLDGKEWHEGFLHETDFLHYLRHVDMPNVPLLTFNADGKFHNKYQINDQTGRVVIFDTPGEMDAQNVTIESFFVGGYRGSMTSDSCYAYTLPTGVTITNQIVGGSQNACYTYNDKATGKTYKHVGGLLPYSNEAIITDKVQLNVFCKFADLAYQPNAKTGASAHSGVKIFNGCLDRGITLGNASLNFHSNMLGNYKLRDNESFATIAAEWNTEGGIIYGAGKGEETEIQGHTYVNIIGARFNGKPCIPNLLNAFAGGMKGHVVGSTNLYVDIQLRGVGPQLANTNAIWGSVYGGGRMGNVMKNSNLTDYVYPRTPHSHVRVNSGMVNYVFGGSRVGDIEGSTSVNIEDQSHGHFHTIVGHVYGGNDVSGSIKRTTFNTKYRNDSITANCYVRIYENPHEDGTYSGFPLVVELYGGGNGNYGNCDENGIYTDGWVISRSGDTIQMKGMKRPDVESTVIDINGGTLYNVYGGANHANVTRDATINVDFVDPEVRSSFNRLSSELCYARGKDNVFMDLVHAGIDDDGYVMTPKWNIFRLFAGNNQTTYNLNTALNLKNGRIGNIYGGCNKGNVDTDIKLTLDAPELYVDRVFGGSRMGNVINGHNTKIEIVNGTYGAVFGGNDITGDIDGGTHMQIRGGNVGEVYGAGNGHYLYSYSTEVDNVTEVWNEELNDYIYYVPAKKEFGGANASILQKVDAINYYRPNCHKTYIEIGGRDESNLAYVTEAIYAGGRCATILDNNGQSGEISIDLGDFSETKSFYLGANGEPHIQNEYLKRLMYVNGFKDMTEEENMNLEILNHHMNGVLTHGLPQSFKFRRNYEHCRIGSFFFGGRRGSLTAHGELNVSFPQTLVITDKIVGGSDRADVRVNVGKSVENDMLYQGGILWDGIDTKPVINMDVKCKLEGNAKVYGGCFESGKIDGSVNLQMEDETEELF